MRVEMIMKGVVKGCLRFMQGVCDKVPGCRGRVCMEE